MTQPERIEGMQRVIAHFEQAYPDIAVELTSVGWAEAHTKFMAAVAGGNPPDIAVESYGWPITYSQMGVLQPLDDVIEAVGEAPVPRTGRDAPSWPGRLPKVVRCLRACRVAPGGGKDEAADSEDEAGKYVLPR